MDKESNSPWGLTNVHALVVQLVCDDSVIEKWCVEEEEYFPFPFIPFGQAELSDFFLSETLKSSTVMLMSMGRSKGKKDARQ